MSLMNLTRILDNASDIPIDHVLLEGGEPFLLHDKLLPLVQEINRRGYWLGTLINGFFARSPDRDMAVLEPLDVRTDLFRSD